ncbi:hypothetical protein IQ268_04330 [Oculatella sp. LEGE 06141]|uniref:hypothetical protein n=1 Tax=Oculatella sp. LEGE 06141 TaxID=1828648 RepID=UPI0018802897|nr:hypothetical protein [Oculatella sp. LEGE 06141]MBE9177808.1 hypothetical protein [Oculatella sp. LEGE 06141]
MKLDSSSPINAFLNALAITIAFAFIAASADGLSVVQFSKSRNIQIEVPVLATSVLANS